MVRKPILYNRMTDILICHNVIFERSLTAAMDIDVREIELKKEFGRSMF